MKNLTYKGEFYMSVSPRREETFCIPTSETPRIIQKLRVRSQEGVKSTSYNFLGVICTYAFLLIINKNVLEFILILICTYSEAHWSYKSDIITLN